VKGFLEHEVPLVRLEALRTLLSFQDPDAYAYVTKFLRSDVSQLQEGAVRLAGAYRIKHAVPHLIKLLREKDIVRKKSNFKRVIVRALGRIGESRVVNDLLNICNSTSGLRKDEFDKLQIEIFKTLHNYPVATIRPLIDYGIHSGNKEIVAIIMKLKKGYDLSTGK
jgi:HEAT repeat protein